MKPLPWAAIGELVEPVASWTPERDDPGGTFPYIDIGTVDQNVKAITSARDLPCVEAPSRARQLVAGGDILVSTVRPNLNAVARVPTTLNGATASTGFCVLRPRSGILDGGYLFYWVRSPQFVGEMTRRATGASYPAVTDCMVLESRIPTPSFPEQRRVAEILDKADMLRAMRRGALAQLGTLAQSIFLHMFGDPATNPKGWPVRRLETEIKSIRYGTGSPPPYVEDGIPFIRATNIKAGTVSPRDLRRISPEDAGQLPRCRVRAGNLIVVRSGVNTGDCAIVPPGYDGACAAFDLIVDLPWANAVFYNFLINSSFGKRCLEPLTRRAAQPHLNAEQFRSLSFIAPEEEAKERFARHMDGVSRLKASQDASLHALDGLFAALQQRAFRAEL